MMSGDTKMKNDWDFLHEGVFPKSVTVFFEKFAEFSPNTNPEKIYKFFFFLNFIKAKSLSEVWGYRK